MANVYNYTKLKHPGAHVVTNPTTQIVDAISPYADVFMTVEINGAYYLATFPPATSAFETNPANQARIIHIVYNVTAADYGAILAKTCAENAGQVLKADGEVPNPYAVLPTNFTWLYTSVVALPVTIMPNRSVQALPNDCVGMTESTSQASVNIYDITLNSQTTSLWL